MENCKKCPEHDVLLEKLDDFSEKIEKIYNTIVGDLERPGLKTIVDSHTNLLIQMDKEQKEHHKWITTTGRDLEKILENKDVIKKSLLNKIGDIIPWAAGILFLIFEYFQKK